MLLALLLPVLLQAKAVAPKPMWSGELTLTMKGSGTVSKPLSQGGVMKVTWSVDRVAKGRVVLDRTFKGGGIAGTPNTRDTLRYETWIADSKQPLLMQVHDTGTYAGPVGTAKQVALDVARYTCPSTDGVDPRAQIRSSILQFDLEQGTFTFETPRLISRCSTSYLRTPTSGPAAWMAKGPFEPSPGAIELEFEMVHKLAPLSSWRVMTGPFTKGATEVVLSRTFEFEWMHPIEGVKAPVQAELTLVLRKGQ